MAILPRAAWDTTPAKNQKIARPSGDLICVVLLSALTIYFTRNVLFGGNYLPGADVYGHLLKVWYAAKGLAEAGVLPQWLPYWYNGLDYLQYSPPLYTLLGVPFQLLTRNVETTYRLLLVPTLIAPAAGTYLLARKWVGRPMAMIAAVGFAFSSLQMRIVFFEGDVAETLAIAVSPWVMLLSYEMLSRPGRKKAAVLGVIIAAMILAHQGQAAMFLSWLVVFVGLAGIGERRPLGGMVGVGLSMLGGIGLSIWWLLPALSHFDLPTVPYVQPEKIAAFSSTLAIINPTIAARDRNLLYFGLPTLVAAVGSLALRPSATRIALFVPGVLSLVLSFGVNLPFFGVLPWTDQVLPIRFLSVSSLYLVLLMAIFAEDAIKQQSRRHWLLSIAGVVMVFLIVVDQLSYIDLARTVGKAASSARSLFQDDAGRGRLGSFTPSVLSEMAYLPAAEGGRLLAGGWDAGSTPQRESLLPQSYFVSRGRAEFVLHNAALWNVSDVVVDDPAAPEARMFENNGYAVKGRAGRLIFLARPETSGYLMKQDRDVLAVGIDARNLSALFPWSTAGNSPYLDEYSDDYLAHFKMVILYRTQARNPYEAMKAVERMLARGQMVIVASEDPALTAMQGVSVGHQMVEGALPARIAGGDLFGESRSVELGPFRDVTGAWRAVYYLGMTKTLIEVQSGADREAVPLFGYRQTPNGRLYFLGFNLLHHIVLNGDETAKGLLGEVLESVSPNKEVFPEAVPAAFKWSFDRFAFDYSLPAPSPAIVAVTYSPHWEVTINGQPARYENHENLMQVDLPAGRGNVSFRYGSTPVQRAGMMLSVLGALGFAALLTFGWRKATRSKLVPREAIATGVSGWWDRLRRPKRDAWQEAGAPFITLPRWAVPPILGAVAVLFALPALSAGHSPPGTDALGHLLKPWYMLQHFRLYGDVPSWLPSQYNGIPLTQYGPPLAYYLLFAIELVVGDVFTAYGVFVVICLIATGSLVYLLSRKWLSQVPSLIAALTFAAAPYTLMVLYWEGNLPRTLASAFLPLMLILAVRMVERDSWVDFVSLGIATAGLILADHLAAVAAFVGLLPFGAVYGLRSRRGVGPVLRLYTGLAVGIGLSAWWLVPAVTHIDLPAVPDLTSLPERVASYSVGQNLLDPTARFLRSGYLGLSILLLSGVALLGRGHGRVKWACAAGIAAGVFFGLGSNNPFFPYMPFLSHWFPERFLQMSVLFLALLAALAIQMLGAGTKPRFRWAVVGLAVLVVSADLLPGLSVAKPDVYEELDRTAVDRLANWLASEENGGRLLVTAPINDQMAFKATAIGNKGQNYGWIGPEASAHTATSRDISYSIAHERYSFALRSLALWNTRYVVVDPRDEPQRRLADFMIKDGWERADLQVPWTVLSRQDPPSRLMLQDRSIIAIGRGATTAAMLYAWLARGTSEYVDDYDPEYLSQFEGIFLYDYRYRDQKKTEQLLTGLAEAGKTVWIDLSFREGELLFQTLPSGMEITGTVPIRQVAGDGPLVEPGARLGEFGRLGEPWHALLPRPDPRYEPVIEGKLDNYDYPIVSRRAIGSGSIYLLGLNVAGAAFLNGDQEAQRLLDKLFQQVATNVALEPAALPTVSEWWQDEAFGFQARVNTRTPVIVSTTYTPHWAGTIDGSPLKIYNHENLVMFYLPPGNHTIRVSYGSSPAQNVGFALATLALVALLAGCLLPSSKYETIARGLRRRTGAFFE